MIQLVQKWEDLDNLPVPASTAVTAGNAMSYNGTGSIIPSTPGLPIVGFSAQTIASTDPDYASAKLIFFQRAGNIGHYRFSCPVGVGTALANMVGVTFNVSATDAGAIDVSTYITLTYNTLAVSTFAVGHTVTGGTSSATGVVKSLVTLPSGVTQIIVGTLTGTFVSGETITDGTSSATAKIVFINPNGTQLKVENVLSASLVEVTVAATA